MTVRAAGKSCRRPTGKSQPQMNRIALLLCEPERVARMAVALIFSVGDLFKLFPAKRVIQPV